MALQHQHQPWPRRVVRNPRILGGEPIIEGTRVPVRTIVEATRYLGDVEEIVDGYPMLDRPSIESALEFYRHHKAETERYIAENQDLTPYTSRIGQEILHLHTTGASGAA